MDYAHRINDRIALRAGELSEQALDDNGRASDSGCFLYLTDDTPVLGRITVIAKLPDEETAAVLFDALASRE